jgi:hypothetical protein
MKCRLLFVLSVFSTVVFAQVQEERLVSPTIHAVQLFQHGDQYSYPIMNLGSSEALELHFDDMGTRIKNYSYTYQLCNADWTPADLNIFDFIKGFTQTSLRQYRTSSVTNYRYVHYQANLPDAGSRPTKSGNYILKVFLNSDTSKTVFTKRFLVVDNLVGSGAQVLQPFNPQFFRTHQRLQLVIDRTKLNLINPVQQLKVVALQNYRWDNAAMNIAPTFIRNNSIEYSGETALLFPGGSEYRWADLRSFRFQSDRVSKISTISDTIHVVVKPDLQSSQQRYFYTADKNGFYEIASTDLSNAFWQGDYAWVHFTYKPSTNEMNKNIFVGGQFNNYKFNEDSKLKLNPETGLLETSFLLKQGYYTYNFFIEQQDATKNIVPVNNYIETENDYTILVYYRSISGRHDELIGVSSVNSRNLRNGF